MSRAGRVVQVPPPSGMFGLDKEELISDNDVAAQSQGWKIRSGVSTRWEV